MKKLSLAAACLVVTLFTIAPAFAIPGDGGGDSGSGSGSGTGGGSSAPASAPAPVLGAGIPAFLALGGGAVLLRLLRKRGE